MQSLMRYQRDTLRSKTSAAVHRCVVCPFKVEQYIISDVLLPSGMGSDYVHCVAMPIVSDQSAPQIEPMVSVLIPDHRAVYHPQHQMLHILGQLHGDNQSTKSLSH